MAPAKNTRSQATTSKDSRARGNALADQSKNEDEKTNIEPVQSNDSKAKIEDWLGKVDDGVDSKDNSTTTKKRRAIKQSASTTVKTQKRLSTYVRVSKSTNKDGKGREEIQEIETGSAVKVTTVSPDRKVTRERHEIITDTTVITTRDADAGKKRKFGEDNDTDYVPSAPGPTVKGLAEAAEEDFGERATKRLRRKLRDSTSVSSFIILLEDVAKDISPTPTAALMNHPAMLRPAVCTSQAKEQLTHCHENPDSLKTMPRRS